MAPELAAITRTEGEYERLRSELLDGTNAPGAKLKLAELASRFQVSQSVVREASTRLTEQGLAVATPQRGFCVRELSIRDICELTKLACKSSRRHCRWRCCAELGTIQPPCHHRQQRNSIVDASSEVVYYLTEATTNRGSSRWRTSASSGPAAWRRRSPV
jgi:DNA-binding transcriptional MocR family regulator